MTTVALGALTFNTNTPDGAGVYWYVGQDGLEGWDAPELRETVLEIPGRDGVVTVQNLRGAYMITLSGLVKCPSQAAYWAAREYLSDLVLAALRVPIAMTVEDAGTLQVVCAGTPQMSPAGICAFEFELNLRADNPVKT